MTLTCFISPGSGQDHEVTERRETITLGAKAYVFSINVSLNLLEVNISKSPNLSAIARAKWQPDTPVHLLISILLLVKKKISGASERRMQ